MQNFSPEGVMQRLKALEDAATAHIPVGQGTESALAQRVTELEQRVFRVEHELFGAAGVGAAQESGVTVDAAELKPNT